MHNSVHGLLGWWLKKATSDYKRLQVMHHQEERKKKITYYLVKTQSTFLKVNNNEVLKNKILCTKLSEK